MKKRKKSARPKTSADLSREVPRPKQTRRKRWLPWTMAIAAGIGGLCVLWGPWRAESPRPAVDLAFSKEPQIKQLQEEALRLVDTLRKDFPHSSDPWALLGNLHNSMGDSEEAVACWQQCLAMDPARADAYRGLGDVAMRRGRYEKALEMWRKALKIRPEMIGVRTRSARALMALGRPEEAVVELEKDVRASPHNSISYFELGQAYRQLKEYEKAKESYRTAVKIQPDYTNAYYGLALACKRLGQQDEFDAYLETFQKLKGENRKVDTDIRSTYDDVGSARRSVARAYTEAGEVYFGHAQTQTAGQDWQRAARLDPENTACRMRLVTVYMQAGKDREALEVCEQLGRLQPNDAMTHLNIGVIHARLGHFETAISAVQRAITLDPDNPDYKRALGLIQERRRRGKLGG